MTIIPGGDQLELDVLLIVGTYLLAILSRFKVLIYALHTLIGIIKLYQLVTRHRVEIDDKIRIYIHTLKVAEKTIFPVVFGPITRIFKKRGPEHTTEQIDSITVKRRYIIPEYK